MKSGTNANTPRKGTAALRINNGSCAIQTISQAATMRRLWPEISFKQKDMTDWQPIETAPTDGRALLLYVPHIRWVHGIPENIVYVCVGKFCGNSWVSDIGGVYQRPDMTLEDFEHQALRPTHWMRLPDPPKGER